MSEQNFLFFSFRSRIHWDMSIQLDIYLTFLFDPKTLLICREFFFISKSGTLVYDAGENSFRTLNLILVDIFECIKVVNTLMPTNT